MNKYLKQIEKAKSMIQLSKIADHIGVKLGRIKDMNKAKAKMMKALEKEQKQVKKDFEKITKARENNKFLAVVWFLLGQIREVGNIYNGKFDIVIT